MSDIIMNRYRFWDVFKELSNGALPQGAKYMLMAFPAGLGGGVSFGGMCPF